MFFSLPFRNSFHLQVPTENPKRTSNKKKKKGKRNGGKGKASFKVTSGARGGLKVGKNSTDPMMSKGTYDLSNLPVAAHPDWSKNNNGAHSYTLNSGEARIEVLLRNKAIFVKRVGPSADGPVGQVSFSKFGGEHAAWREATRRAGFV